MLYAEAHGSNTLPAPGPGPSPLRESCVIARSTYCVGCLAFSSAEKTSKYIAVNLVLYTYIPLAVDTDSEPLSGIPSHSPCHVSPRLAAR